MGSRWICVCLLLCSQFLNIDRVASQEMRRFPHYCNGFEWQHGNEPDLAGFRLYCGPSPDQSTWALINDLQEVTTQATCEEMGLTHLGVFYCGLSAYDTAGNESARAVNPDAAYHYLPLEVREPVKLNDSSHEVEGGVVILRATQVDETAPGVQGHLWEAVPLGGAESLRAWPNTQTRNDADFVVRSPRASFQVTLLGGRYAVWVRGYAGSDLDGSVHVGADGIDPGTASKISGFSPWASWRWSRDRSRKSLGDAYLDLAAGEHTIDVWMREDGFAFSTILLNRDLDYMPSDAMPLALP